LTVSVLDVNDVAPNCSQAVYVATVSENDADADVLTITCQDLDTDSPNNEILSYTSNNPGKS